MAKKIRQKATERNPSASLADQQHKPVELIFNKQTNQPSISKAPPLDPRDSLQASQLSRELYSALKQADAAMEISVHAILIVLLRIGRSPSEEYETDEQYHQYVN